jgi:hypothetical protein
MGGTPLAFGDLSEEEKRILRDEWDQKGELYV